MIQESKVQPVQEVPIAQKGSQCDLGLKIPGEFNLSSYQRYNNILPSFGYSIRIYLMLHLAIVLVYNEQGPPVC